MWAGLSLPDFVAAVRLLLLVLFSIGFTSVNGSTAEGTTRRRLSNKRVVSNPGEGRSPA